MKKVNEVIGQGRYYFDRSRPIQNEIQTQPYSEPNILDENHRLRRVVLSGPPGVEAYLAQLLPVDESLFLAKMDVAAARKEFDTYDRLQQELGTTTHDAKQILSERVLPGKIINHFITKKGERFVKDKLLSENGTFNRAKILQLLYDKVEGLYIQFPPDEKREKDFFYKEKIAELLDDDIKRYGEQQALALNLVLSVIPRLPLGNFLYARDQMNVVLDTIVVSAMKKGIRQPEVELYKIVYEALGHKDFLKIDQNNHEGYDALNKALGYINADGQPTGNGELIKPPEKESFEGGDLYIHEKVVYIGVGARTSFGAAYQIYNHMKEKYEREGYKMVIVFDQEAAKKSFNEAQDSMHIDTWSMPIGPHQMEMYVEEGLKRKVLLFDHGKEMSKDNVSVVDTGKNYVDFLSDNGYTIYPIPLEEQKEFGCNNIYLGLIPQQEILGKISELKTGEHRIPDQPDLPLIPFLSGSIKRFNNVMIWIPQNKVLDDSIEIDIVPIGTNVISLYQLLNSGKAVVFAPLFECTRGYGAAHCMTGQIHRSDILFN